MRNNRYEQLECVEAGPNVLDLVEPVLDVKREYSRGDLNNDEGQTRRWKEGEWNHVGGCIEEPETGLRV